jgi:hypothetical protein
LTLSSQQARPPHGALQVTDTHHTATQTKQPTTLSLRCNSHHPTPCPTGDSIPTTPQGIHSWPCPPLSTMLFHRHFRIECAAIAHHIQWVVVLQGTVRVVAWYPGRPASSCAPIPQHYGGNSSDNQFITLSRNETPRYLARAVDLQSGGGTPWFRPERSTVVPIMLKAAGLGEDGDEGAEVVLVEGEVCELPLVVPRLHPHHGALPPPVGKQRRHHKVVRQVDLRPEGGEAGWHMQRDWPGTAASTRPRAETVGRHHRRAPPGWQSGCAAAGCAAGGQHRTSTSNTWAIGMSGQSAEAGQCIEQVYMVTCATLQAAPTVPHVWLQPQSTERQAVRMTTQTGGGAQGVVLFNDCSATDGDM